MSVYVDRLPDECYCCVCNDDYWRCGISGESISHDSRREDCPLIEIVRCKDCIHRNWETKGCKRNPSVVGWLDDDFCNYGKKQVTGKLESVKKATSEVKESTMGQPKSQLESDLISRQAAIKEIELHDCTNGAEPYFSGHDVMDILKCIPPVEPKIYGNEHNCIMTMFGECSYSETGCGSCEVVAKVFQALKDECPPVEPKPVCEDAISREWIKNALLKYGFTAPDMTVTELIDDAPSVIPQGPNKDAISRRDLSDKVGRYYEERGDFGSFECFWILDAIRNAPPVEPKRLPQPHKCVVYRDGSLCRHPIEACSECPKHEGMRALKSERPKGEWIFNPKDAIDSMFAKPKCNKCGFESADGGNFCPNCGADMRGDEE